MEVFNSKKQKQLRQKLRNQSTPQEQFLWKHLRARQCGGYKFVRQYGVGRFVVDFYCAEKRLAIELDGSQHNDGAVVEKDRERTDYLMSLGIRVLRFWNNDVDGNIEGVVEVILKELEHPQAPS